MTQTVDGAILPDEAVTILRQCQMDNITVLLSSAEGGDCPTCGGRGWIDLWELVRHTATDVPRTWREPSVFYAGHWHRYVNHSFSCTLCNPMERSLRIADLLDLSGLVGNEREWQLSYIEGLTGKQEALEAARLILAQTPTPDGWHALFGAYGVGKSGILKSLTAAFIRAGVPARYIRAADMLVQIRSTYHRDDEQATREDESELRQRFGRYPFLAIDELDRIPDTAWARSTFMSILDDRYNARNQRATVMATNLPPGALGPDFGYLESRMKDAARIPIGGVDMRGR